ncbi:MAG: imidazole glycerol phosphate synthase subunit HisH [Nannocystaceae bacterium]|nr:imidazole glycerol phosphate synthase subunit HisH [bacterium]
MNVGVIRYGAGNIDSVVRALEVCGATPLVIDDAALLDTVGAIVLPGVGAFGHGMAALRERGFIEALQSEVLGNEIPFLGICLGMQLLATRGEEGPERWHDGLGWIEGDVSRLPADERVPHVGWNEVYPADTDGGDALMRGIDPGRDFYFVHSYRVVPDDAAAWAASTPYGAPFCSAVVREHIWGVQFHPEKSQSAGFEVLKNFLEAAC